MQTASLTPDRPTGARGRPTGARGRPTGARGRPTPSSRRAVLRAAALALLATASAFGAVVALRVGDHARRAGSRAPVAEARPSYAPRRILIGLRGGASAAEAEIRRLTGIRVTPSEAASTTPHELALELPPRVSVTFAAQAIGRLPGLAYAVPDYVAHLAGDWYPDDVGRSGRLHGWEKMQWNFLPRVGVNAPAAWANLLADHRPGARGVVVAVVDTGIAYRNWHAFTRSPDMGTTRFVAPCDLVAGHLRGGRCTDPNALDREGHGTFVASMIAESTNNHVGLTGLAYEAKIMPVRVLDVNGNGDSSTIATGIRYAVQHGAQVINLSIEFSPGTTRAQIPDVSSAITYAHDHGVVVVSAAGNDQDHTVDYPAALADVISVGATTSDACLAVYSNIGRNLDLVAPGGGDDAASVPGSKCHPPRNLPDVYQMTFPDPDHPAVFGLPGGWFGTSMAAPAVSAAAAMVIASGVLGAHPTPTQVLDRLEATAKPLGIGAPNSDYGYGLIDIGAATSRGGPLVPTTPYALPGASASSGGVVRVARGARGASAR